MIYIYIYIYIYNSNKKSGNSTRVKINFNQNTDFLFLTQPERLSIKNIALTRPTERKPSSRQSDTCQRYRVRHFIGVDYRR